MKSLSETRRCKTKTRQLESRGRLDRPVWVDPGGEVPVSALLSA